MYSIYIIRNKTNSKLYVGQTNNMKRRQGRHKYEAFTKLNNKPIYRSIRKYGLDNFEFIEIEQHTKETIDEAEQFWVQFFRSNKKEFGYNLTGGGQLATKTVVIKPRTPSMLGKHHSEETKQSMSEQRQGAGNSFFGKQHSQQSKQLMSQNPNRKFFGADNPFYGKKILGSANSFAKLTDEIVLQARKLHREGMTFVQLSKMLNVSESAISRAIRGITWPHLVELE
jgi:group I intron endonuclease